MNDTAALWIGFFACAAPIGLVVALVIYVMRTAELRRRIVELEHELAELSSWRTETTRYLSELHARLTSGAVNARLTETQPQQTPDASPAEAFEPTASGAPEASTPDRQPAETPSALVLAAARADAPLRAEPSAETQPATPVEPGALDAAPEAAELAATVPGTPPEMAADTAAPIDAAALTETTATDTTATDTTATDATAPTADTTMTGATVDVVASHQPTEPEADVAAAAEATPGPDTSPPATAEGGEPPRRTPKPSVGLEQWLGVRGAAAAGAVLLVVAAFYFFEYSIEHGFITPAMRIVIGAFVGVGCLLAGELKLRRSYELLANFLDGAGVAILYVTIWAGRGLYDLYPNSAATVGMIAITATCVTLASVRRSAAIATLGLVGGFLTPLALSTGHDRPYALFGYLMLLDLAMLALARVRRWPLLALASLGATSLYQLAWLSVRLDEPRLALGVAISVGFALVFAAWPGERRDDGGETFSWRALRVLAVTVPMLFALVLALRTDLGAHFWPTATQLAVLCLAGSVISFRQGKAFTGVATSLGAAGVLLGWAAGHPFTDASGFRHWLGLVAGLGLLAQLVAELDKKPEAAARRVASASHLAYAAVVTMVAVGSTLRGDTSSPYLLWAYFAMITLLSARAASFPMSQVLPLATGALTAIGWSAVVGAGLGTEAWSMTASTAAGLGVGLAALTQLGGVWPRAAEARRGSDWASVAVATLLTLFAPTALASGGVLPAEASALALALLGLLAASRIGVGAWVLPVLIATVFDQHLVFGVHDSPAGAPIQLAAMALSVLLFSFWPLVLGARRDRMHLRAAALAAPLYFFGMRRLWLLCFGAAAQGLLPVGLALVSLGGALVARAGMRRKGETSADASGLLWSLVAATLFLTAAIPLQLEREWITIGWALEAVALVLLFRRFEHPGLKYLAATLGSAVFVRLVMNPYLLDYHLRGSLRVLNWLSYTYLVPFVCLVVVWKLLSPLEVKLRQPWERGIFPEKHAVIAPLAAVAATLVLFVWVNLTVFDIFAPGRELTIPLERLPARDLSLSLAWALFALGLLAVGLLGKRTAPRVASLVLILLTAAKTFLYDLGHLSDLYRVGSIVGLAVSLLIISLVYRFLVFNDDKQEEPS